VRTCLPPPRSGIYRTTKVLWVSQGETIPTKYWRDCASMEALDDCATIGFITFKDKGSIDPKTKKKNYDIGMVQFLDDPVGRTPLCKLDTYVGLSHSIRFGFSVPDEELADISGISLHDVIKKKYEHDKASLSSLAVDSFDIWKRWFRQTSNLSWSKLAQEVRNEKSTVASTPKVVIDNYGSQSANTKMDPQFYIGSGPYENFGDYHISKAQWNKFWNNLRKKVDMKNIELDDLSFHPIARLDNSIINVSVKARFNNVSRTAKDTATSSSDLLKVLEPLYLRVIREVDVASPPTHF